MRCFKHSETEAVGICKNCNKGVCTSCLMEVPNGIACSAICEEELVEVNNLIQRNKTSGIRNANVYFRNALIYGLVGSAFIYAGYYVPSINWYSLPLGIIFFIAMIIWIYTGFKQKK